MIGPLPRSDSYIPYATVRRWNGTIYGFQGSLPSSIKPSSVKHLIHPAHLGFIYATLSVHWTPKFAEILQRRHGPKQWIFLPWRSCRKQGTRLSTWLQFGTWRYSSSARRLERFNRPSLWSESENAEQRNPRNWHGTLSVAIVRCRWLWMGLGQSVANCHLTDTEACSARIQCSQAPAVVPGTEYWTAGWGHVLGVWLRHIRPSTGLQSDHWRHVRVWSPCSEFAEFCGYWQLLCALELWGRREFARWYVLPLGSCSSLSCLQGALRWLSSPGGIRFGL